MLSGLRIASYRFSIQAQEELHLPPYKGSTLRGGFGVALKRVACYQRKGGPCRTCLLKGNCPYAYIFESILPDKAEVLRRYSHVPLPFVIEPPLDERAFYKPGEALVFGLVLVGRAINYFPYFLIAFMELGKMGLGKGRGKYALQEVRAVHPLEGREEVIYSAGGAIREHDLSVGYEEVAACARRLPEDRVRLHFLTPVRIKHGGRLVSRPDFHHLVRALLRRISALYYFHCGRRWDYDFTGAIERAQRVRTVRCDVEWEDWERYSGRQGVRLKMGGFVGEAEYEGGLAEFRPLLLLGQMVHVGKACGFGNGRYEVDGFSQMRGL